MLRYYSENGPEHYVPIQKKLIEQAYQMLAEGGELLYSTCTFSVKENEEVIAGLLDAHPDMEVQEITPGYEGFAPGVSVNGPRSFPVCSYFPAADGGRRPFRGAPEKAGREPETAPSRLLETTKKLPKEAEEISCWRAHGLEEWVVCPCERPALFSAGRCLCGKGSALSADRTFAWHRKEKPLRAVPGAGGVSEKEEYVSCLTIPKGDDRVMRYLKGETLSFSEEECQGKKGWVLVCLDDFPLGWGKINNGR